MGRCGEATTAAVASVGESRIQMEHIMALSASTRMGSH